MIFGNICVLVDDFRDLFSFISVLLFELEKVEEYLYLDLCEVVMCVKMSLMKGIDVSQFEECKVVLNIVKEVINGVGVNVDVETQSYAVAFGGWVMDFVLLCIFFFILLNDIKCEFILVFESVFEGNI